VLRLVGAGFKGELQGLERVEGSWEIFFRHRVSMTTEMGAFSTGEEKNFTVLIQSMPHSYRLLEVTEGRVTRERRFGAGFPLPRGFMAVMMLPQAFMFLIPMLLVLILSGLMRRHRVADFVGPAGRAPFAPLTRRAFAAGVDGIFLATPTMAGSILWMVSFSDMEEMFFARPVVPILAFVLVFLGFVWMLGCLALFSWMEGKTGATPGKRLMGIRALSTDLKPCGFGRAFLRKILMFVDGFFSFLVGIGVIAFTENRQRVGDVAAKTVVVMSADRHEEAGEPASPEGSGITP
jgi:uncharacterized RDD family membrane protein YckC